VSAGRVAAACEHCGFETDSRHLRFAL
jgi:hypothetical protein